MSLTKTIQGDICKAEIRKGNLVAENFSYYFAGELDVVSVNKSGYVTEFEVKISRSDFKADAKKTKWNLFQAKVERHLPNYFVYVCPEGLISEADLKPYMGLIYYNEQGLKVIKKASIIHKHKHDLIGLLGKMLRITNWKNHFGGCQLTVLNREAQKRREEFYRHQETPACP